jgi:nucleotide-binding universal stress UspA family protein
MRLAVYRGMSSEQTQVVVGFDFSESAVFALERSIALAIREPFHVVHLACILDPHKSLPHLPAKHIDIAYADRIRDEIAERVELELKAIEAKGKVHFHVHVRVARNPADELLLVATEVGADLIIIGSKGLHGVERVMRGSVSERMTRDAGCEVIIARPKRYQYVDHADVVEVEETAHRRAFRFTYDDKLGVAEPLRWPGA